MRKTSHQDNALHFDRNSGKIVWLTNNSPMKDISVQWRSDYLIWDQKSYQNIRQTLYHSWKSLEGYRFIGHPTKVLTYVFSHVCPRASFGIFTVTVSFLYQWNSNSHQNTTSNICWWYVGTLQKISIILKESYE